MMAWTHSMLGIIPAGAGLTYSSFFRRPGTWDHPRGCGAHLFGALLERCGLGSSPRVRGSPVIAYDKGVGVGIIPAGAGLTITRQGNGLATWDHPRGCGAHAYLRRASRVPRGSSPRVRGSLCGQYHLWPSYGIIPAGAGLTNDTAKWLSCSGDHPRGCGAHGPRKMSAILTEGSSPRVRGSHGPVSCCKARPGIIPAGAGLTSRTIRISRSWWDHPRGCGAHYLIHRRAAKKRGSSPRVRGSPP